MLQIPELLAPAGDLERLRYAINYGADAVYCGLPEFGMRSARPILHRNSWQRASSMPMPGAARST